MLCIVLGMREKAWNKKTYKFVIQQDFKSALLDMVSI